MQPEELAIVPMDINDQLNWNNNNKQIASQNLVYVRDSSVSGDVTASSADTSFRDQLYSVSSEEPKTNTGHVTPDTGHVTPDIGHVTSDTSDMTTGTSDVTHVDLSLVPYDGIVVDNVTSSECREIALLLAATDEADASLLEEDNRLAVYQKPVKTGDVERERLVEERVKQLGLWNNKRILERCLRQRLREDIDADGLFQAINRCKRKRPIRDRVESTSHQIVSTIQPQLIKDDDGNKLSYKIDIIMGIYTHNVRHKVSGQTVVIQGSTPQHRHANLHKEVTIEFPPNIDMSLLDVSFSAGVFKCEAPFKTRYAIANHEQLSKSFESVSSVFSEETESVTSSDMKSVSDV